MFNHALRSMGLVLSFASPLGVLGVLAVQLSLYWLCVGASYGNDSSGTPQNVGGGTLPCIRRICAISADTAEHPAIKYSQDGGTFTYSRCTFGGKIAQMAIFVQKLPFMPSKEFEIEGGLN